MAKVGILLHVYHLETKGWEALNWGYAEQDLLGTTAKFAEVLLRTPVDDEVVSVIYSGPSQRDGLTEGAYTKRLLMERVGRLSDFDRLQPVLDSLTASEHEVFLRRLQELEVGPVIKNTLDEVKHAAEFLNRGKPADRVLQVCAASHAPRCLKSQLLAHSDGTISRSQEWYVAASEVCFEGTTIEDVVIIEPPHRGDDPMAQHTPSLSALLKPYPRLAQEDKLRVIDAVKQAMSDTAV